MMFNTRSTFVASVLHCKKGSLYKMSSFNKPAKVLFKIHNISDDEWPSSISISLPNNDEKIDKIKFELTCNTNVDCQEYEGKSTIIRMYLTKSNKRQVSIHYRLSIVNQSGKNVKIQKGQETFLKTGNSAKCGVIYRIDQDFLIDPTNKLITIEKVLKSHTKSIFRTIEKLIICCEMTEIAYNCDVKNDPSHDNSLTENLQTLLETGKHSDVLLFVGDKELRVHKNILAARSNVFKAMFEHDCEEKKQNRVEITDIQLDVCEELLSYIYTAKIESMDKLAVELLVASDKYELEELKTGCEGYLMENLSIETAADILLVADLHQAKKLKAKCIDFISENSKKVQSTAGWKTLATKADLAVDLFVKLTDKYEQLKLPISSRNMPESKPSTKVDSSSAFLNYSKAVLSKNIGALIKNEKFGDAVLILEDGEMRIHKNILSVRSKVFANILEHEQDRVELPDLNVEVCKQLLRYIYTNCDYDDSMDKKYAKELLMLSEKYQLSGLKAKSEYQLSQSLEIETVSSTLLLADKHNAPILKEKCIEYITENSRHVTQTEEWKILANAKPELVVQLYEHNAANQWR